jgi:outer membrane protein TolC
MKTNMNVLQRAILTPIGLLIGLASSLAQTGTANGYSLEACIAYAHKNSVAVQNAYLDTRIARHRVKETWAMGLPQINGSGEFNYNYKIQQVILPPEFAFGDPGAPPPESPIAVPFGVALTSTAAVTARQLLFDGTFFLGLKAADVYEELSRKSFELSKIDVASNVTKAYYGVLVAKERQKLIAQNLTRLELLLNETRAMYQNGFAEKIDVDRIEVNYNNIKSEKVRIDRSVSTTVNVLKFQMGMPIHEELVLSDRLSDVMTSSLLPNLDEKADYGQRKEFSILETQRELDLLNVRQYRVGYYPNAYLINRVGLNSGGNALSDLSRWFSFGLVGLQLEIPIFDGMRKKHQIEQAKLQVQRTENDQVQLKRSIDLEVSQAIDNLENSIESLKIAQRNMELAAEIFRVARIKYQEGVGSTLEVSDAETSYKEAETNYYTALYDALIYRVDYQKAIGELWKE